MTAGDSKAATTITQPALVSSPQSRPAPTRRALPSKPVAQRGQNWTPIRGQICKPIDTYDLVPVRILKTLRCQPCLKVARGEDASVRLTGVAILQESDRRGPCGYRVYASIAATARIRPKLRSAIRTSARQ